MATGRNAFRLISVQCAALVLALLGCKADIPDGVYRCRSAQDCPDGFSCRREHPADSVSYCFARDDESGRDGSAPPDRAGKDGGATSPGGKSDAGAGDRDGGARPDRDAGLDAGEPLPPPKPTSTQFSSLGERRSGEGLLLYDDGFEPLQTSCTPDGVLCVTGGFGP